MKSKLTQIAEQYRTIIAENNVYYEESGKIYTDVHPNATTARGGIDDPSNIKGKNVDGYLNTSDGGSDVDKFGLPYLGVSGRIAVQNNIYNEDKQYDRFPE